MNDDLKNTQPYTTNDGKNYAYCPNCEKITEQCQYSYHPKDKNSCIECNGGVGYSNECNECYHDQNSDDD